MEKDKFLEISRSLAALNKPELLNYHITRYKFFYENTTKLHDCKYCQITYELSMRDNEINKLKELGYEIETD